MELGEERIKEIKEAYDLYDPLNKGVGLTQIYNILQCLGIDININELNCQPVTSSIIKSKILFIVYFLQIIYFFISLAKSYNYNHLYLV